MHPPPLIFADGREKPTAVPTTSNMDDGSSCGSVGAAEQLEVADAGVESDGDGDASSDVNETAPLNEASLVEHGLN